MTLIPFEEDL